MRKQLSNIPIDNPFNRNLTKLSNFHNNQIEIDLNNILKQTILTNDLSNKNHRQSLNIGYKTKSKTQIISKRKQTNSLRKNQQEQQQMHKIYQENQKLGYRINYLNDQNNFYKISINNIQKLNNNIQKDLDVNKKAKSVINLLPMNQNNYSNLLPSRGLPNRLILNRKLAKNSNMLLNAGLQATNQDKQLAKLAKKNYEVVSLVNQTPTPNITESFSLISNKIHLKNLQMKVGNSIRKTQKLKKIYEGSVLSLTKKAYQLQLQINKLTRQAQYYLIEEDLLKNIYKADYYLSVNYQWLQFECQQKIKQKTKSTSLVKMFRNLSSTGLFNQQRQNNKNNQEKNQKHNKQFKKHNKISTNNNNSNNITQQLKILQVPFKKNNKMNGQLLRSNSNSQLLNFIQKQNAARNSYIRNSKTLNKSFQSKTKQQQSQGQLNQFNNLQSQQRNQYMTQKQLFQLPQQLIQFLITSLQKQQMQQGNKLQSLRKQQKQQIKKKNQMKEQIEKLQKQKKQLKEEIQLELLNFRKKQQRYDPYANNYTNYEKATYEIKNSTKNLSGHRNEKYNKRQSNHSQKTPSLHSTSIKKMTTPNSANPASSLSINQKKLQADQLFYYHQYQKQLFQSIMKQDKLLQEQYKINQEYKQKIIDRNQQQNKQIKVLQEEVNKCMEQVRDIKVKYKNLCMAKGKNIGVGSRGDEFKINGGGKESWG